MATNESPADEIGTVLVVDDDPAAVDIICRLLAIAKIRTRRALGGEQALAEARSAPVDLILLDVSMPFMDGLSVKRALMADERTRDIPVVLLTARDDYPTRSEAMKLGVSEFLTKPVNKSELFSRVRALLESSQPLAAPEGRR